MEIEETIQACININREEVAAGNPPVALLAIHSDSRLPDDLVLLAQPVLLWARQVGIRHPDPSVDDDRRRFFLECLDRIHDYYREG